GKRIRLDPQKAMEGGEAQVFNIGGGKALKLYKPPNHPSYAGSGEEHQRNREGARLRLIEYQHKLREFPKNLPPKVIAPEELVFDKNGKIIGYVMRYLSGELLSRYAEKGFSSQGITNDQKVTILRDLYETISRTHAARVVAGDINYFGVIVIGHEAYLIDADGFQFGRFLCRAFTERFVDPLLCDPKKTKPILFRPYSSDSDWYAFAVMLMECLLFTNPYGGVYRPKDPKRRITQEERPLRRISIFHPEVGYPKPAIHYRVLPDDLLQHLHLVFEKDKRGEFPKTLLSLRWTKCLKCGTEHTRDVCPNCAHVAPAAVKEVTVVRGKVTATRIARTSGVIVFAASEQGKLSWLYHENGQLKRKDDSGKELLVLRGDLSPDMRFRIQGEATLIGKGGQLTILDPRRPAVRISVDSYGSLPIFDANKEHYYWTYLGQLVRDGQFGLEHIGNVLSEQTLFWVGPRFGFGFYRASSLNIAFVFDAFRRGISDSVKLPPFRGQLIDSTCVFTESRCWFFRTEKEGSQIKNQCFVIRADGTVEAEAQGKQDDGSWLGTLRGKFASGDFLLAATDEGIVRVEIASGHIQKTKEFPDTEPFVNSGCHLFPGKDGLYVVDQQEIRLLSIR
ncbi:MAG: hypothetical protein GTO16_10785, partial [Candidatus Aminicenantes bacterium]|nr:hypothetical protein [Candidatus Aminicenantes bacterium]